MKLLHAVVLTMLIASQCLLGQVFNYKRQDVWKIEATPSLGIFLGHTGIDDHAGKSVSDMFRWGAGLTLDVGRSSSQLSFSNRLRLEYQESHSTGQLPIKGPSTFEFATRPVFRLVRDRSFPLDLAFQGGCFTALLPETNGDGEITREFFNPASLYEGLFLSSNDTYSEQSIFRTSMQLGYAFEQLVYRKGQPDGSPGEGAGSGAAPSVEATGSTKGSGIAFFFSFDFTPRGATDREGRRILSFAAVCNIKAFHKRPDFVNLADSRVEASLRTAFSLYDMIDLASGIEVIYDSAVSFRRELRTTVSISFRYNMEVSG